MYERSAVILERYFARGFHYNERSNVRNNCTNYYKLVEDLEKYLEISKLEDESIEECEEIAQRISKTQKEQGALYEKVIKMQEERNSLFENIDESADELGKKLKHLECEIDKNNENMKSLSREFEQEIQEFNEKSDVRSQHGKKRRKIESTYRDTLEKATHEFSNIDLKDLKSINTIISAETIDTEELKEEMIQNGKSEKVPFDEDVIDKSIEFGQDLYKKEAELFVRIYGKMKILLNDINDNTPNMDKYKKVSKSSRNKLAFIKAEKEYLVQFLDNERVSVGLGKKEHAKLMKEACEDLEKDIKQINNLYEILLKEISGKATQKIYKEAYNIKYLRDLEKNEKEFNEQLKKLNLIGKIVNPIYWRIDEMRKIYKIFDNIVTEEYGRDFKKIIAAENEQNLPQKESKTEKLPGIEEIEEEKVKEAKKVKEKEEVAKVEKVEETKKVEKQKEQKTEFEKELPTAFKKANENKKEMEEEISRAIEKQASENKKIEKASPKKVAPKKVAPKVATPKRKSKNDDDDDAYENIDTMLKKRKAKMKKEKIVKEQTSKKEKNKKSGFLGKFAKLS